MARRSYPATAAKMKKLIDVLDGRIERFEHDFDQEKRITQAHRDNAGELEAELKNAKGLAETMGDALNSVTAELNERNELTAALEKQVAKRTQDVADCDLVIAQMEKRIAVFEGKCEAYERAIYKNAEGAASVS